MFSLVGKRGDDGNWEGGDGKYGSAEEKDGVSSCSVTISSSSSSKQFPFSTKTKTKNSKRAKGERMF